MAEQIVLQAPVRVKHASHKIPKWSERNCHLVDSGELWFFKEDRMKEVALLQGSNITNHNSELNCLVVMGQGQREFLLKFENAEKTNEWKISLTKYSEEDVVDRASDSTPRDDNTISKFARLKKTIASKASGTSAGKRVILRAFGEEGLGVVEAVTAFAEEIDSHETAEMVMINTLRVAVKIGILLDDRVLTATQFRGLLPLAQEAVPFLSPEHFTFAPSITPVEMEQLLRNAKQTIEKAIAPHVSVTTLSRLTSIFDVYTKQERLIAIQNNPNLQKQRKQMVDGLCKLNRVALGVSELRASLSSPVNAASNSVLMD